jgi:hypothetical protein
VLQERHLEQAWYKDMLVARSKEDIESTIARVHELVAELKTLVQTKHDVGKLQRLQARFARRSRIFEEGRVLLLDAPLTKIGTRGQAQRYRFFLFNDALVYASKPLFSSRFKLRRLMALEDLRVHAGDGARSFRVEHPDKSFTVQCHSAQERRKWLRAVTEARHRRLSTREASVRAPVSLQATLSRNQLTGADADAGPAAEIRNSQAVDDGEETSARSGRAPASAPPARPRGTGPVGPAGDGDRGGAAAAAGGEGELLTTASASSARGAEADIDEVIGSFGGEAGRGPAAARGKLSPSPSPMTVPSK